MELAHRNNPDLNLLKNVFEDFRGIEAVYLFGSTASGGGNRYSDLDLAVYPGTESIKQKKLDILTRLAEYGFCHVDLVFLDGRNILLEFEAVRHNRLVFARPEFDQGSVFSITLRKYFDFLPYLKVQRQAYKEQVLNG